MLNRFLQYLRDRRLEALRYAQMDALFKYFDRSDGSVMTVIDLCSSATGLTDVAAQRPQGTQFIRVLGNDLPGEIDELISADMGDNHNVFLSLTLGGPEFDILERLIAQGSLDKFCGFAVRWGFAHFGLEHQAAYLARKASIEAAIRERGLDYFELA